MRRPPPTELQVLARARRRARRRDARLAVSAWVRTRVVPVLGSLVGFALASVGAFTLGVTLGLFITAILVFLAEWRLRG